MTTLDSDVGNWGKTRELNIYFAIDCTQSFKYILLFFIKTLQHLIALSTAISYFFTIDPFMG